MPRLTRWGDRFRRQTLRRAVRSLAPFDAGRARLSADGPPCRSSQIPAVGADQIPAAGAPRGRSRSALPFSVGGAAAPGDPKSKARRAKRSCPVRATWENAPAPMQLRPLEWADSMAGRRMSSRGPAGNGSDGRREQAQRSTFRHRDAPCRRWLARTAKRWRRPQRAVATATQPAVHANSSWERPDMGMRGGQNLRVQLP